MYTLLYYNYIDNFHLLQLKLFYEQQPPISPFCQVLVTRAFCVSLTAVDSSYKQNQVVFVFLFFCDSLISPSIICLKGSYLLYHRTNISSFLKTNDPMVYIGHVFFIHLSFAIQSLHQRFWRIRDFPSYRVIFVYCSILKVWHLTASISATKGFSVRKSDQPVSLGKPPQVTVLMPVLYSNSDSTEKHHLNEAWWGWARGGASINSL